MTSPEYRVRRATLDDVGQLAGLWNSMRFAADDLAKRITEFQVAEQAGGRLLGAVGLQISERQGLIHSEGFTDFAMAEQLRPLLWERLNSVAINHGLVRLWTEEEAPFWSHCGLTQPDAEVLQKLPVSWRSSKSRWLCLKLRDEPEAVISLDKEFALFMEAEKQRTARAFQQARILKLVATLVAVALFGAVLLGAIYLMRNNFQLPR